MWSFQNVSSKYLLFSPHNFQLFIFCSIFKIVLPLYLLSQKFSRVATFFFNSATEFFNLEHKTSICFHYAVVSSPSLLWFCSYTCQFSSASSSRATYSGCSDFSLSHAEGPPQVCFSFSFPKPHISHISLSSTWGSLSSPTESSWWAVSPPSKLQKEASVLPPPWHLHGVALSQLHLGKESGHSYSLQQLLWIQEA